jgi:hypothetical protein
VGAEVARVSRRTRVDVRPRTVTGPANGFGPWFQAQRHMRGVSVYFVAARTELLPEAIEALEEGDRALTADGRGRQTVRALARAIGADPEQAVAALMRPKIDATRWPGRRLLNGLLRVGSGVALVAVVGLGIWSLADWIIEERGDDTPPALVYSTDYVKQALADQRQ